MPKKFGTVVYIMRAQPPHKAHIETCAEALDHGEKLIIFIGSAYRHPTIKNPWTYEQRVTMVQDALKDHFGEPHHVPWSDYPPESVLSRIQFAPLRDYLYSEGRWISEVQAIAGSLGAEQDPRRTAIIGCKKDDSSYYLDAFPFWKFIEVPYKYQLDATDIRSDLFELTLDAVEEQGDTRMYPSTIAALQHFEKGFNFQAGMPRHLLDEWNHYKNYAKQWEAAPYVPSFVTSDALVHKSGCVLLVRRGFHPGKGLWAMPGGFVVPDLDPLENSVKELKEETKINVRPEDILTALVKEHSFRHPKRSLRGRTFTFVHEFDLGYGPLPKISPTGGDDADMAKWVTIADLHRMEDVMFEDHYDIVSKIISKY